MTEIERLLQVDRESEGTSLRNLNALHPDLPVLLDVVEAMHGTFRRGLLTHRKQLSAEAQSRFEALGKTDVDPFNPEDPLSVLFAQEVLALDIHRNYLWAATDLRRYRVTPAMRCLRVQIEAAGVLLLIKNEPTVAGAWLNSGEYSEVTQTGPNFYKAHHQKVRAALRSVGLSDAYDKTSRTGQHTRFSSVVPGLTVGERMLPELALTEVRADHPLHYLAAVAWFLAQQAHIFRAMLIAQPDHDDPMFLRRIEDLDRRLAPVFAALRASGRDIIEKFQALGF